MTDDDFYDQQKAKIEAKFQEIDKLKINKELTNSLKSMTELVYFLELTPKMKEFLLGTEKNEQSHRTE